MESSGVVKIHTSRFGDFDVNESSIIEILGGVIGFPGFSRFILLEYNSPFSWLHSVENPDLAFVVVNAAEFGDNYLFPLPFGDPGTGLAENDEVAIVNIVSVRPNPKDTTVNLKAPIVVNLRTMRGRQIVLDQSSYSVRFPLWAEDQMEQNKEEQRKEEEQSKK